MGSPIHARWTRIWWRRPVTGCATTRVAGPARSMTAKSVRAGYVRLSANTAAGATDHDRRSASTTMLERGAATRTRFLRPTDSGRSIVPPGGGASAWTTAR